MGSWEPVWCCPLPDPETHPNLDVDEVIERSTQAAAEILYNLTAQRFGLCAVTVRPCRRDCWDGGWPFGGGWGQWSPGQSWPQPVLHGGTWFNIACGGCPGTCTCTTLSEVLLPGPVNEVTEVRVDGQLLTPGVDYTLYNHRVLTRVGGTWPRCNDLNLPDTEPGTWSVTAVFGEELPASGRLALGELACAFIDACVPGRECPLPQPVQRLVRQGVEMTFLDPNEVFANGRIGLTQCDLFISWANPRRLHGRPQVYDVDAGPLRSVT